MKEGQFYEQFTLAITEPTSIWQPLNSAPKDGTAVLLIIQGAAIDGNEITSELRHDVHEARYSSWENMWRLMSGEFLDSGMKQAVAWRPLPELPVFCPRQIKFDK